MIFKKQLVIFLLLSGFLSGFITSLSVLAEGHQISFLQQSGQKYLILKHAHSSHSHHGHFKHHNRHHHNKHQHFHTHTHHNKLTKNQSHGDHIIKLPSSNSISLTTSNHFNILDTNISFKYTNNYIDLASTLKLKNPSICPFEHPPPQADQTLANLKTIRLLA